MNRPRIVFAGTPRFGCPALEMLIVDHRPVAVLTQPDRPAGRGRRLTETPVKQMARAAGLEVLQPRTLTDPDACARLKALAPDLLVTAAYGLLLPRAVLDLPRLGCWNLHASLLPRWRGASPIQQAILAGDRETGITLMQMDTGLDTGAILMRAATPIGPDETAGRLHDRLAAMAAELLSDALERLVRGTLPAPRAQDGRLATRAPLIGKADARIDWNSSAGAIARAVRAFNPWPVAHGEILGQPVRIFAARPEPGGKSGDRSDPTPGTPITGAGHPHAIRIACGSGVLRVLELQAPGRKRLTAEEWLNAHPAWRG